MLIKIKTNSHIYVYDILYMYRVINLQRHQLETKYLPVSKINRNYTPKKERYSEYRKSLKQLLGSKTVLQAQNESSVLVIKIG